MKKVLLLAIVATAFGMTSCKKDYTCTCTTNGISASVTIKDTKSKAREECEKGTNSLINMTCVIK